MWKVKYVPKFRIPKDSQLNDYKYVKRMSGKHYVIYI